MSSGTLSSIAPAARHPQKGETPADAAARTQLAELAREFESVLIAQMLRQMRESFLSEEDQEAGFGGQTLTDTMDVEVARALAAQGGVGLGSVIERGLRNAVKPDPSAERAPGLGIAGLPSAVVGPSTRPAARVTPATSARGDVVRPAAMRGAPPAADLGLGPGAEAVVLTAPLGTAVTSGFGWRSDPFHGRERFHAGVDFRAAYGREVPTAAPGRVVFAGSQGAYGQTVVVEHADGLQTRYAHLSAVLVKAGEELASNDIVGRVGQSGRATGPHLHFEVVLNGQRVDPSRVASTLPGALKYGESDADSTFDRVSAEGPGARSEP